jgi:hypothetical protein
MPKKLKEWLHARVISLEMSSNVFMVENTLWSGKRLYKELKGVQITQNNAYCTG